MNTNPPAARTSTVSLADEEGVVDWAAAQMLRPGFEVVSPADMQIPQGVDGADHAIASIREHQVRWQAAQRPPG